MSNLVTEFGPAVPRTKATRKMANTECYKNAAVTAMEHKEWRYAEGWAFSGHGWWFAHAWNVDDQGRVLDRTWTPAGTRYVGRPYDLKEIAELVVERGWFGPVEAVPFGMVDADETADIYQTVAERVALIEAAS
jgi:hypothetical protein